MKQALTARYYMFTMTVSSSARKLLSFSLKLRTKVQANVQKVQNLKNM